MNHEEIRAKFEKWISSPAQSQISEYHPDYALERNLAGKYDTVRVQGAWEGYLAATLLEREEQKPRSIETYDKEKHERVLLWNIWRSWLTGEYVPGPPPHIQEWATWAIGPHICSSSGMDAPTLWRPLPPDPTEEQ